MLAAAGSLCSTVSFTEEDRMHMLRSLGASGGGTNKVNTVETHTSDFSLECPLKVSPHYKIEVSSIRSTTQHSNRVVQRVWLGHIGSPLMPLVLKKTETDSHSAPLTASDPQRYGRGTAQTFLRQLGFKKYFSCCNQVALIHSSSSDSADSNYHIFLACPDIGLSAG